MHVRVEFTLKVLRNKCAFSGLFFALDPTLLPVFKCHFFPTENYTAERELKI